MPRRLPDLSKKRRINPINSTAKIVIPETEVNFGGNIHLNIAGVEVIARPYNVIDGVPEKYATSCPKCGHGIFITALDVKLHIGAACSHCQAGQTINSDIFIDPFVNPLDAKLVSEFELSEELVIIQENQPTTGNLNTIFNTPQPAIAKLPKAMTTRPKPPKSPKPLKSNQLTVQKIKPQQPTSDIQQSEDKVLQELNPELIDILGGLGDE